MLNGNKGSQCIWAYEGENFWGRGLDANFVGTGQIEDKFSTRWIFVRLGYLLTEQFKILNAETEVSF